MSNFDLVKTIKITASADGVDPARAKTEQLSAVVTELSNKTSEATKAYKAQTDALNSNSDAMGSLWAQIVKGTLVVGALKLAWDAVTGVLNAFLDVAGQIIGLVWGAVMAVPNYLADQWAMTTKLLADYIVLANKAGSLGVSTDFFQEQTQAATKMGGSFQTAIDLLAKLKTSTQEQLGGSTGQQRVNELQSFGNFKGNTGVDQLAQATSEEEKYKAVVSLIDQAMQSGERLAAIDVAKTFFGDEAAANLAKYPDYFDRMQTAADKITGTDLISSEDVSKALDLSYRLQVAENTISKEWFPAQQSLNSLVVTFKELWVDIVELVASGFTWVEKIVKSILSVPTALWEKFGNFVTPNQDIGPQQPDYLSDARKRLTIGLSNPNTVALAGSQTSAMSNQIRKDKSKSAAPDEDDTSAYDRATASIQKYIEVTKAASTAVDAGAGEQEKLRAIAQLTAAGLKDGLTPAAATAQAQLSGMGTAAGIAADALAKAKVASEISRGSQLAFVSPEDVAIANQLKGIYGDNIPAALASSQAAALRFNNVLSTINTTIRSGASAFANDFVSGLEKGETILGALKDAAANLGKTLQTAGLNSLVTTGLNALAPSVSQTAGATSSATILTAAGTSLAAAMVAGATAAAAILTGGGTAAGVGIDVGTSVGGAELVTSGVAGGAAVAAGGTAAGVALWGPIAALAAVAAGIGLSMFGGSSTDAQDLATNQATRDKVNQTNADAASRRQQDLLDAQTASSTTDPNSLQGQLQTFDLQANQQRQAEAKAGNGAIVELEQSLAAQRLAIVQKSNAAITQTMDDFLNSVMTGSQSILSPADQLAYEQNLFNSQFSGAQGGNSDDLNALTNTASALLTLAQNFYASGTGYADTYKNVTNAIQSIANNPGQTGFADSSITNGTDITATIGSAVNGVYSNPTGVGFEDGGIVGNGIYNKDSVIARYAGGGNIGLAGGEAVTRASSVNANTIAMLSHINRTGKTPSNDNSEVVRVLTQGFNGQTQVLSDRLDKLTASVAALNDTTRITNTKRRVPGTKAA